MIRFLEVVTQKRTHLEEITDEVQEIVDESGITEGICYIYVPHTTAGVFINENADPDVKIDIEETLEKLIPWQGKYRHIEGNAAAHIKSVIVGTNTFIPIKNGKLMLGTWQGIFFAEFDGPRTRKVIVKIVEG
ncbi:secondary thiamine-phosphate synthase enzyme [Persephonella hydrogeniphila]|uniref:Secondary thiamine-phosphate synthase enzyme n=1 Tax=Persephonella hydrogeniphila TaxID=198703 RepID=A0A285NTZ7_9AQUI|nr:secondary thiamine-phosphate synthase enzyme YjbQ [Persephonella hydrogeniphila]SNZ11376.1 secondary thiamine-phosphate synthase enzyme [Persephonella hydrogeniphila]